MIRHLKALGADRGLIIEAPILELLGIDERTPLHISTDGEALIIRPVRAEGDTSKDSRGDRAPAPRNADEEDADRTIVRGAPPTAEQVARLHDELDRRSRLQGIAERLMDQHDETFRKLAQ